MAFWAASGGSGGARALRPVLQRGSMARVAVMGARRPIVTWPTQPSQSSGAVLRTRLLQGRPSSSSSHPFQRSHWQQQQQPGGSRQEFSNSSGGGGSGAGRAQSRLWFLSMRAQAHPCKMYIHPHHTTPRYIPRRARGAGSGPGGAEQATGAVLLLHRGGRHGRVLRLRAAVQGLLPGACLLPWARA